MQAKHLLQLTLDMSNPIEETMQAISAVAGMIAKPEDQRKLLQTIHDETGILLKGADADGEQVRESSREQQDK